MEQAGIRPEAAFFDEKSRQLQFATDRPDVSLIRVRSFDVATFVAFGAAHFGVVGSDVLDEYQYPDLYAPVDLGIGKCRLSIAAATGNPPPSFTSHLRVATKYPNMTQRFYARRNIQAECIKLNGAMELAPRLGLCDTIVDLVSTGNTLKANALEELEVIAPVSSRLIVNRGALKTCADALNPLIHAFKEAAHG